jgi:ParB family chromosome partitioning protein
VSKRKALGQGLDALLGEEIDITAPNGRAGEGIRSIPVNLLIPNPDQPREHFDGEALKELAESIRQQGVIQPVLAEERADGRFMLVAGERRWRACSLAGLDEIPAIVRKFSPEQKLEIALVENIQREDLTPMEEARAFYHLMEALGLSQQELADKVGKNRSTVANSLRLLKLPEDMREAVETARITPGHARALLSVTNPADQELLFNKIIRDSLSVRDAEAQATEMNRGHKGSGRPAVPKSRPAKDPEIDRLEQLFIDTLGTRVSLKGDLTRGRMEISWYSRDDLDRLYEVLVGKD